MADCCSDVLGSHSERTAPMASASNNVSWHTSSVGRDDRAQLNGHRSAVLWFTGLSGSGKSTIANAVLKHLHERGVRGYVLDGDNIRHGLCQDLGFGDTDREENIRRIGEVSKLFLDAGLIVLTAFVSPFQSDRFRVKTLINAGSNMDQTNFVEIYCAASLESCEKRDTKGLYRKARLGQIPNFTGISSPYQEPESPDLILESGKESVETCTLQIIEYLQDKGIISKL